MINKASCGNGHEIARNPDEKTIDGKYLTHKKLVGKLFSGDVLKKCPDCNSNYIIWEKIPEGSVI